MEGLNQRLKSFAREGKTIKIGLAGMGQMGKGIISQISGIDGMEIIALADRNIARAEKTLKGPGIGIKDYILLRSGRDSIKSPVRIEGLDMIADVFTEKARRRMREALDNKMLVYSDSLSVLFCIDDIDVIIDATGNPETGAYIAVNTIVSNKHLVTLNVEMDVTIGPILRDLALSHNVVYTLSAGDEPPAAKELYDFADMMGMSIIAAGKGKNNPLDREANPDTLAEYSREKGSNPYMMTSFVDGTKSMVEMACLSNATGLRPDCRGMHGPRVNIDHFLDVFRLKSDGGILDSTGVVEFVIGDLAPGVFLIFTTGNKILRNELEYLLLGRGPNYLLYRPYHLTSMETPVSIARAYFYGEATMVPLSGLVSDVITIAKKDLVAGERIDRIGGYKVYGLIDKKETAEENNFLPAGLSEGALLKNDIEKNSPITYNDVNLAADSLILRLRKIQERRGL
jgi:predicted homoserine dehydrogenase-like protein